VKNVDDFLIKGRGAEMQWVQDPNQNNVDNLQNVRREVSRHFRNKQKYIRRLKLINLKPTVRSKISETCVGASVTSKRVTSLELI